jgi:hypothetical protein
MRLLYKAHIHLDYDIDVDEHIVHCMVMENNRYARNKKNDNYLFLKERFFMLLLEEYVCINLCL